MTIQILCLYRGPNHLKKLTVIQEHVESLYAKFIHLVATARNMEVEEVQVIAEGRVWTGIDAKAAGLV